MEIFMVGRDFNTYKDLLEAKGQYEKITKTLLTIKDSSKFANEDPRFNELIYARLQYHCKAGAKRRSTSKGNRKVSSVKVNCPVFIKISERDGKLCVVQSMLDHQNHSLDSETFYKYPENARLKPIEIKFAKQLLAKGYTKQSVKDQLIKNRNGRPLPKKFWSQIYRNPLNLPAENDDKDENTKDCKGWPLLFNLQSDDDDMREIPVITPDIQIKEEAVDVEPNMDNDDSDHWSDKDNDPLSNLYRKCYSNSDYKCNPELKATTKNDFDRWFKSLIPGEELSYDEWLWHLELNFPTIDKLNFIKYGIILGMNIVNKYYCDDLLRIDINGITEVNERRPAKRTPNLMKNVSQQPEQETIDADNQLREITPDISFDEHINTDAVNIPTNNDIPIQSNVDTKDIKCTLPSDTMADSGVINCKLCPETFPTHSQLYSHMCKMHMSHIGVNCPICNKRFHYERSLNVHISTFHSDPKNLANFTSDDGRFICELCGAAFDKITSLRAHTRYSHSTEKFYCSYCNRKLSSKKALKEHIRFQHEEAFVTVSCDDCNRIFKYKSSYRMHMRKQHGIHFR